MQTSTADHIMNWKFHKNKTKGAEINKKSDKW